MEAHHPDRYYVPHGTRWPILGSIGLFLIVMGAGVILIPGFPLVKMILLSQVLNGMLLPFVLIFMIMIVNKERVMREWKNSPLYNVVAWGAVVIMIGLTLALAGITVRQMLG